MHFLRAIRSSNFFVVFNREDELARGRIMLIMAVIMQGISAALFNGTFYTGFMLANGIDTVEIGVIGFIPNLCVLFSLFSPAILSKFPKRKWILISIRFGYYFFLIVCITVLPYLALPRGVLIFLIGTFLLLGHMCNALSYSGWFVWHKKLLPDHIRPSYMSYQLVITGILNAVVLLGAAFLADWLKSSGQELTGMVIVRSSALVFALLDLVFLSCIKEYPYDSVIRKNRFVDTFVLPFRQKKYMLSLLPLYGWLILSSTGTAFLSVHLLDTVQVSYSMINAMTALYAVFLLVFTPFWKKFLSKHGIYRTLAFSVVGMSPAYILYIFISPDNSLWLYPLLTAVIHFCTVGVGIANALIPYASMPQDHEECYSSFYIVLYNMTCFFGSMLSTSYVGVIGDASFTLFGIEITSIPQLILMFGVLLLVFFAIVLKVAKRLEPES